MWNHRIYFLLHAIICWSSISSGVALHTAANCRVCHLPPSNSHCFNEETRLKSKLELHDDDDDGEASFISGSSRHSSFSRRSFTSGLAISVCSSVAAAATATTTIQPASASELGAMITKAVTTSDLGISVRKSVVKGAQMMDRIDGQWEKFSDDYGLGTARFNQGGRPKAKKIPPLKPLSVELANKLFELSDEAFIEKSGVTPNMLSMQISKVDNSVRKSFERSGIDFSGEMSASIFNYNCYIHFKAYCDIIMSMNASMGWNKKGFEKLLGDKILQVLAPSYNIVLKNLAINRSNSKLQQKDILVKGLEAGLKLTDEILANLVSNGLVALAERNQIDNEKLADWTDDLAEIQLSIPLDGDITLNSQVLLQEQGFRVYPDFARFAITSAFQQTLANTDQSVSSDEYYMDTDYSSDPNQFEVKQVLLNIVIDSN